MGEKKKIAFCITCMNRLSHIQQTLVQNMEDNWLPDDVEFILLDYNSTDGLEEWVKTLQKYIDLGILHYYRTEAPKLYHRSHSRNIAFRLSTAEIVCNLDADNFLGFGFAEYIINKFAETEDKIFITSNFRTRNVYGRFCAYRSDFMHIRGYNESLTGYGAEDADLFNRLIRSGLKINIFYGEDFYKFVEHSYKERVSQEYYYQSLFAIYISYSTPFRSGFLLLRNDFSCETGYLINNIICNYNLERQSEILREIDFDRSAHVTIENDIQKGKWIYTNNKIHLTIDQNLFTFSLSDIKIRVNDCDFFRVIDDEMVSFIIMHLSDAVNYAQVRKMIDNSIPVNPVGFGQGTVYRNFDYSNPIILN